MTSIIVAILLVLAVSLIGFGVLLNMLVISLLKEHRDLLKGIFNKEDKLMYFKEDETEAFIPVVNEDE